MAYEPKPGQFSLFPNDRKANASQPDYKGDGKDLQGNDVWVSAWLKDGAKGPFMSCSMQLKSDRPASTSSAAATQQAPAPKQAPASKPASSFSQLDDSPPF